MDDLYDDIERGCLENGEPIEARWGGGWWSEQPEPESEYYGGECPYCGREAWYCEGEFCDCPECGKTYEDVEN